MLIFTPETSEECAGERPRCPMHTCSESRPLEPQSAWTLTPHFSWLPRTMQCALPRAEQGQCRVHPEDQGRKSQGPRRPAPDPGREMSQAMTRVTVACVPGLWPPHRGPHTCGHCPTEWLSLPSLLGSHLLCRVGVCRGVLRAPDPGPLAGKLTRELSGALGAAEPPTPGTSGPHSRGQTPSWSAGWRDGGTRDHTPVQ